MKPIVYIFVVLALTSTAFADNDFDSNWRDGCPPGNLEKVPDVIADSRGGSAAHVQDAYDTDARLSGAAPQFDSAFVPSRIAVIGDYSHLTADDGNMAADHRDSGRARLLGSTLQVAVNAQLHEGWVLGVQAMDGYAARLSGDMPANSTTSSNAQTNWSNFVLAAAIKHHWLSSFVHVRKKWWEDTTDTEGTIAALRHAAAGQIVLATPWTDANNADALAIARRNAFDSYQFIPHGVVGGFFEYRSEGVGCYAPFFHLRLGAFWTRDGLSQSMLVIPETVAGGLSVGDNVQVFFQYGLLVALQHTSMMEDPVFGASVIHRFRFGFDWADASWGIGAYLDYYRGSDAYGGAMFGLHLSYKPWGSRT